MILRALRFAFALLRADRWPCLFDEHPDRYWPEPVENGPRCRHCDKPLSKGYLWTMGPPEAVSPDDPIANGHRWREALELIAGTDPVDAALDPDRAIRVAREALR